MFWGLLMRCLSIAVIAAASTVAFTQIAAAADMSVKAPIAPVPAPIYSWTGFYVGGNIGYSWGKGDANFYEPSSPSNHVPYFISGSQNLDGVIGGGQIGFNWQSDKRWVFGLEADFQGSGQKGSNNFSYPYVTGGQPFSVNEALSSKIPWFGTVRGRAGVLVAPNMLLYVTGGLAYGKISTSAIVTNTFAQFFQTCACGYFSFDDATTKAGWTLGAGVEGAIPNTSDWTWKAEYLYIDFGTVSGNGVQIGLAGAGFPFSWSTKVTDNIVRVGLNYRFDMGKAPVVARY
jgi:outer membrane immunogenic protein